VTAIQGNAVSAAAPADGQVLQWSQSNNQYQPAIAAGCAISGGAAYWAPFAPVAAGSYAVSGGSSTVNVFLIVPQCTVKFSNVAFDVTAANSSSCTGGACGLAVGIYDAAGNKISQAVAVQGGSPDINSTGYKNLSWGSTVTLNAGTAYYLATASDSATLGVLKVDQTNSQQLENILNAYTTLVSVGQAANHSTGDGASLALPASLGSITAAVSLYTIPPVIVLR
jgi:hypothetical protein